jgi:3-oxoacyl-[acyl-carrier protein] reductase
MMNNYLLITGGSQGIGKSIIALFLKHHWKVINLSRHPCPLATVTNIRLDLTQRDPWDFTLLKDSLQDAEKICLVHNAAVCPTDTVQTLDDNQLRHTLELNVVAPARLNTHILPLMRQGSSIIYIGSTLSEIGVANTASYVTSKHAIAGLMKATCQDLDNTGIHTCCICPGFTETTLLCERMEKNPNLSDTIKNSITARRFLQPDEIANFVWFCAHNPSINGAVLHANLGMRNR